MSKRLGRGLDALISSLDVHEGEKVVHIGIDELRPNPYQPRKTFAPEAIEELKQSILQHGIIQPIIVKKSIKGYDIIAGERRYRASKAAGLKQIPAVIKDLSDAQVMEIALIENIQREDLNAIEEAVAYQKLMERFSLTQIELAQKVGKSRSHIANLLRLLYLPDNVQEYVSKGILSMGHARALVGVKDRKLLIHLAKKCIEEDLNVRELEALARKSENVPRETSLKKRKKETQHFREYSEQLQNRLGTQVKILKGEKKGKIEIEFFSREDLERILLLLNKESGPL